MVRDLYKTTKDKREAGKEKNLQLKEDIIVWKTLAHKLNNKFWLLIQLLLPAKKSLMLIETTGQQSAL